MNKNWKNIPLGIPMTLASLGTIATLGANKRLHVGFGILWAALSLWHGLQHGRKLQSDMKRWARCEDLSPRAPKSASALQQFLSTLRVRSFVEGRIRLYSPYLVNDPDFRRLAEAYVCSLAGVRKAEGNTVTGSLLVEYYPEELRKDPELALWEERLGEMHAR